MLRDEISNCNESNRKRNFSKNTCGGTKESKTEGLAVIYTVRDKSGSGHYTPPLQNLLSKKGYLPLFSFFNVTV